MRDDTTNLRTKWLICNCESLVAKIVSSHKMIIPDLHFRPICLSPSSIESAWYRVVLVVEANDCVSR